MEDVTWMATGADRDRRLHYDKRRMLLRVSTAGGPEISLDVRALLHMTAGVNPNRVRDADGSEWKVPTRYGRYVDVRPTIRDGRCLWHGKAKSTASEEPPVYPTLTDALVARAKSAARTAAHKRPAEVKGRPGGETKRTRDAGVLVEEVDDEEDTATHDVQITGGRTLEERNAAGFRDAVVVD